MRLSFAALFMALVFHSFSQSQGLNNALKMLLQEQAAPGFECDILVEANIETLKTSASAFNFRFNYSAGDIASIRCNYKLIPTLLESGVIRYAEFIPARKKNMNDTMRYRNRLVGVKAWTAPLPRAYNGEGILMGIIDTGIDFSHPDFKDSLGRSRIQYIWEQAKPGNSSTPQPFNYGIEWLQSQIDHGSCTHSDAPNYGHGTHVSGIAAGNGLATGRYEGCASKAQLAVVALDFGRPGPSIADAVNYLFSKAAALGKPCVINASVGDYYGSHDGTDLEARLIDNMLKNTTGKALVAAAGNAGYIKFHTLTQPLAGDTLFTWLNNSGTLSYWCYGDTQQVKNLRFSVGANRQNFSNIGRTAFHSASYGSAAVKSDTLRNAANKRIGIIKTSSSVNTKGVYELYVEIQPDTASLLWRIETTGSGRHHAWNFDFVSTGLPSASQYPQINKYVMPDTMYTIVTGFQCSDEVITVANYVNLTSYYDVNNTLQTTNETGGNICGTSSSGPTRDGRIKPDITATGQNVISTMVLSMRPFILANAPQALAQDSMHVLGGGSSAASPVVAGLAALYLQRYPTATNQQVRDAIRFCAYSDGHTGQNLPDYRWGFGKLDGKAAMSCGEGVYNVLNSQTGNTAAFSPNPFSQSTAISIPEKENSSIFVYDVCGRQLFNDRFSGGQYSLLSASLPANYAGVLILRITNTASNYSFRIIKEN